MRGRGSWEVVDEEEDLIIVLCPSADSRVVWDLLRGGSGRRTANDRRLLSDSEEESIGSATNMTRGVDLAGGIFQSSAAGTRTALRRR